VLVLKLNAGYTSTVQDCLFLIMMYVSML